MSYQAIIDHDIEIIDLVIPNSGQHLELWNVMFHVEDWNGKQFWAGLPFLNDGTNIGNLILNYLLWYENTHNEEDVITLMKGLDNMTKNWNIYYNWYWDTFPNGIVKLNNYG